MRALRLALALLTAFPPGPARAAARGQAWGQARGQAPGPALAPIHGPAGLIQEASLPALGLVPLPIPGQTPLPTEMALPAAQAGPSATFAAGGPAADPSQNQALPAPAEKAVPEGLTPCLTPSEIPDSLHPVRGPNRMGVMVRGLLSNFRPRSADMGAAAVAAVPAGLSPARLAHASPAPAADAPARTPPPAARAADPVLLAAFGSFQVAIESLALAVPAVAQKLFADFTVVVDLTIYTYVTELVGRQSAGALIRRFGLKGVYIGVSATRAALVAAMAALYAADSLTLPLIMGLYSVEGWLDGVQRTAVLALPPAALGQDHARLERFETWHEVVTNLAAIVTPPLAGLAALYYGFLPALLVYPAAMLLSGLAALPLRLAAASRAEEPAGSGFLAGTRRGFESVWKRPLLKATMMAYAFAWMLVPLHYAILGPGVGLRLTGDSPEAGASVFGWLTGFYSAGFLIGGWLMLRSRPADLKASLLKWMAWGLPGILAVGLLALPFAPLAGGFTIQGLLAMVPLGIAQMVLMTKLRSLFQSRVPEAELADASAFFGTFSLALAIAVLIASKALFAALPGMTPVWVFAAALVPAAAWFLSLRRSISRHLD